MPDEYLSHTEVAAIFNVHRRTLARWRDKGDSPRWQIDPGGRYRYLRSDVEAWARNRARRNGPPSPPPTPEVTDQ